MKNNNKIISFLKNYRKVKSVNEFTKSFILLLIATIASFISFVFLERFIFFSSDTRIRIDILLLSFFLSLLILFIIRLLFQIKGKLKKFRYNDIAKEVGARNTSISDRLINAFQLKKNNLSSDISRNLRDRAIKSIENQIPRLDRNSYSESFKQKPIFILLFA